MSHRNINTKLILMIIALVSFSVMFSISIVGPLLNEIAIQENIPLGANPNTVIGVIFSAGTLALALFQIPFAALADKIGRKKVVLIGTFLLSIVVLLIGYVGDISTIAGLRNIYFLGLDGSLMLLGTLRTLQGVFAAATWPILMALVVIYFKEENMGLAMGIFGASFGLGMSLGPVIGLSLVALLNIYSPFILSALFGFISTAAIFLLPREEKKIVRKEKKKFVMDRRLMILSFIAFMLLYSMGSIVVIYPRFMRNILGMDVKDVAIAMAAASLTYTFLQPLTGKVADKIDKRLIILSAGIPFLFIISSFGYAKDLMTITILMMLFGVLGGFIFPASNSLVGVIAPEGMENLYSGFYNMMLSLGVTVSPIVIGILSDLFGYGYAYLSNGTLMFIVLIMFLSIWNDLETS